MEHLDKDRLFSALQRDEGRVLNNEGKHVVYRDPLGYWTRGYGKLVDPEERGAGLTEEEARYLLQNTLCDIWDELVERFPWVTDKPIEVQEALLNQAYNLGVPRLAKFKNMLWAIETDDGEHAFSEALNSKWAKQVGERAYRIASVYKDNL